ncbi:hypothetical protein ACFYNX_26375 [Streptomyces sp. NPDC007872]|uniref:hypothetical protein n=1 Tax=Streptomyces sp. NPDC007872 TaxID=3364782 RepID=UPI003694C51C
MTTPMNHPVTVTARINPDTDTAAVAPAPAVYIATVYVNTACHSFGGYQHHHLLAEATRTDGSPLRLVFNANGRTRGHEAAAEAAFEVGNGQSADDKGQTWPADIRSVSVGDVIKVTGPDHWIIHLSVERSGFSAVPEPTHLTDLAGSRASSRR